MALTAAGVCLAINVAIFAGVALNRPDYLRDYRLNDNSDAVGYVLLGRNIFLEGQYSRCERPPYLPDMLRTPVYPLFAGGLDLLSGPWAIYAAQAFLQAGSCILLFAIVRPYFGTPAALVASLLLATDLMLAVANFEAVSEPLFVFAVLAAILSFLPALAAISSGAKPTFSSLALAGLFLGLAILTRPVALYLPAALASCLAIAGLRAKRLACGLAAVSVFLIAAAPLPALWLTRNWVVCSVPKLTTVDAANQVYYVASGAFQVHFGISPTEARAMIAKENNLPSYTDVQNPWLTERPVAEMDAQLRAASFRLMTQYPVDLAHASVLGVIKASVSHNAALLAAINGKSWTPSGFEGLARFKPEAYQRIKENGPVLAMAFVWEMLHIISALALGSIGVANCLIRRPANPVTWTLLITLAYFYFTIAGFGVEAFYRCRMPALPFLYVFAGIGLAWLFSLPNRVFASWVGNKVNKSLQSDLQKCQ
jgi:4-amino-4-deoxy-L-arabinose transferase-like glycosyltransferase